jgi:hypothetical protein
MHILAVNIKEIGPIICHLGGPVGFRVRRQFSFCSLRFDKCRVPGTLARGDAFLPGLTNNPGNSAFGHLCFGSLINL